jgi:hypothetical protein
MIVNRAALCARDGAHHIHPQLAAESPAFPGLAQGKRPFPDRQAVLGRALMQTGRGRASSTVVRYTQTMESSVWQAAHRGRTEDSGGTSSLAED